MEDEELDRIQPGQANRVSRRDLSPDPPFTPHHYNAIAKGLRENMEYEARILLFWPLAKTFQKYDSNFNLTTFAMRLLPELPDFINDSTN